MKRLNKKSPQKHELEAFAEKYDTLALMYGDPVEIVFAIMHRANQGIETEDGRLLRDDELALQAANTLMGYRYPKVKAVENAPNTSVPVQFNIQLAPPREIEVRAPHKAPLAIVQSEKKP